MLTYLAPSYLSTEVLEGVLHLINTNTALKIKISGN